MDKGEERCSGPTRVLLRKNLAENEQPFSKTPISNQYSLVAFQR